MAFLELKKYRETSKDEVRKPWLEFFGNKPFTQQPERSHQPSRPTAGLQEMVRGGQENV